jgi:hypothetical protein
MAVALLLDDGHVDVDTGLVMTTTTTTGGAGWKDDGGGQDTTGFSCSGSATPLHRASFSGAISAMQLLLTHGANLFTKDTSFGDGRTPLHKAVAGGRPLAVKLLLEALSNKSNNGSTRRRGDDNNEEGEEEEKDLLQLALEMKDAYGQTPIELAQHYCTQLTTDQIEYEKQSVRRWDVVAGGDRADWNACLRLLLEANAEEGGRTGQTMITTPFSWKNNLLNQQENTIENNQRGNGTLDNGTDRHNENTCQDDGRCCSANIISKWESEFRKAFLATTTNNTTSSSSLVEIPSLDIADVRTTMKLASDIATKDSDEEDHAKTSSSIQSPMQHDANDESDPLSSTNNNTINNALSNKSHFIVAGAPNIVMQNDASEIIGNNNTTTMMGWQCENCGIHTMALFRLSVASTSRLVCRNCRRRKT